MTEPRFSFLDFTVFPFATTKGIVQLKREHAKSGILQVSVDCLLQLTTTQPQPPEILPVQNLDNTPFNQKQVPYHSYIRWKYYGKFIGDSTEILRKYYGKFPG